MKVSELAKELNTSSDTILKTLKSFKLKAKDSGQELSAAVISVVKSELTKRNKAGYETKKTSEDTTKAAKAKAEEKPKTDKKTTTRQKESKVTKATITTAKKTVAKKTKTAITKKASTINKKSTFKAIGKPRIKIGKEPVITLKPLGRKRRKSTVKDEHKVATAGEQSASSATADVKETSPSDKVKAGTVAEAQRVAKQTTIDDEAVIGDEDLQDIELKIPITIKDFSVRIQQKPSIVLKNLMQMGFWAHINQSMDADIVDKLARQFGYNIIKLKTQEEIVIDDHKQQEEDPKLLSPRAPVVTLMGHVDHGKTTLLDKIRKSNLADAEHGGITQHIGAYSVTVPKGKITFLDTPGHEAFTAMRARGAHITDLVVLVVAADEGVMPQTQEAIDHAKAANVPIVVALNKIDRKNADADRVKKQLAEVGLNPEDWGGKNVVVGVSGVTGEGVDQLLEMILLESELLELKANADKKASGIIVEAHLSRGKGAVSTLIVQSGTLKENDFIVVGSLYGKIKAMFDDHDHIIKDAGPSMPVEVLGLSKVPKAGELFYVVDDERQAREIALRKEEQLRNEKLLAHQKLSLEDLYSQIQEGTIKELSVILKADVQGSLEALKDSLEKIPSDKVKIRFIHTGVGDVNLSDVLLAAASQAIIIAFHIGIGPRAKTELEKQPVEVRQYRIIYDAVADIRKALEGLLDPKTKKNFVSRLEIREVFKLSKAGIVAGCYVVKGKVHRKVGIDITRNGETIYSGVISSLKRFKDDVREVNEGMECGVSIEGFDDIVAGDMIEAYELETISQKL